MKKLYLVYGNTWFGGYGEEIMCIVQGYHIGSLSDELLRNHVVAIWYEESILNTINILIGGKNIDI